MSCWRQLNPCEGILLSSSSSQGLGRPEHQGGWIVLTHPHPSGAVAAIALALVSVALGVTASPLPPSVLFAAYHKELQ